ncbi:MAG: hypothetical protein IKV00_06560 [Clostridia bacterium]|nr:hypothetical protein [Clostridia bacterium]
MRTTQEILIDNQIPPTMLRDDERMRFAEYLDLVRGGRAAELVPLINEACRKLAQTQGQLSAIADQLTAVLGETLLQLDRAIGDNSKTLTFSHDASTLTKKHVRLVKALHEQLARLSEVAATTAQARNAAEQSFLAPQTATDLLLMRAALGETDTHKELRTTVTALGSAPSPAERMQELVSLAETLLCDADERLSSFVTASSETITDVNRGRRSAVEYLHLLRRELLALHDLKEAVGRMKNEALRTEIPRAL